MSFLPSASPCLLLITLCYVVLCAVSPFGNCRRCRGFGFRLRRTVLTGRLARGRDCRRCRGYGKRIRFGRHLYNVAVQLRRDGSR